VAYVVHLAGRLQPSSIPRYLNVIRLLHLEAGMLNPLKENWELLLVRKGINRVKGVAPVQKLPITIGILRSIHSSLSLHLPFDAAFWLALLIGFYGFLRKSTLLPSVIAPGAGKFISRDDILDFSLDSFSLRIKHSKVIQFGQRELILPYARVLEVKLCPIRALLVHKGLSPLPLDSPLFNYRSGVQEVSFLHKQFVARLKAVLSAIGVDATKYSAHSLRRGGASFAFRAGMTSLEIKQRGDWSSSCYERYIHLDNSDTKRSSRVLAAAVSSSE
jgi:hypothetical protein